MSKINGFLGQIEDGQTDDLSFIDGLDSVEDLVELAEGLGAIARNNRLPVPVRNTASRGQQKATTRAKTIGKSPRPTTTRTTAGTAKGIENENELTSLKTMLENRIMDIRDPEVRKDLEAGNITVIDGEIYSARQAVADTKLFEAKLNKAIGVRNVNNAQLESGSVMLVTHIALEHAVTTGLPGADEDANALLTVFEPVGTSVAPALLHAEFNLLQYRKPLIVELPVRAFTYNQTNEPEGFMRLKRPILLQNKESIDCRVVAPDGMAYPAGTYLNVRFKGGITVVRGLGSK